MKAKFGGKFFQTKLLPRLSHKFCRLLSSPVVLRRFTINETEGGIQGRWPRCANSSRVIFRSCD